MDAKLIAQIFNDGVGSKYQTLLKGGRNEPAFIPNKNMNDVIEELKKIRTKVDNSNGIFMKMSNFLLVNLSIKKPEINKVTTDKIE